MKLYKTPMIDPTKNFLNKKPCKKPVLGIKQSARRSWEHDRVCRIAGEGADVDEEKDTGHAQGLLQPGKARALQA